MSGLENKRSGEVLYLVISILLSISGLTMLIGDKAVLGIDYLTQLPSGYSGYFLILIGTIFFVIYYFTLSPFSRIRKFFEGGSKIKSKNRKK
jgi:phosphotransferase system  glucose/maltose/N-acetylglucosamine-specific IIC component